MLGQEYLAPSLRFAQTQVVMWLFYAILRAAIAMNQKRLVRQQEAQDRLWRVLHPLLAPGTG